MAGWKELLLDVLKLTDETKRLNEDIDRLQIHVMDVDKRLVRLETLAEVAKYQAGRALDGAAPNNNCSTLAKKY